MVFIDNKSTYIQKRIGGDMYTTLPVLITRSYHSLHTQQSPLNLKILICLCRGRA